MDVRARIAAEYRRFGEIDARPRSPFYDRVAHAVAEDHRILGLLAAMPVAKQQPNLLFGAVRYLYGTPATPEEFLALVREHSHEILGVMATRTTQTNEPARCSTLLPALALLPPPLALLEVGASAGLCLLPDRYEFDYGARRIPASEYLGTDPPVFRCSPGARTPLPRRNLDVVWRAGLDLNPIDLRDPREVQWLEALVWPGEEYRIPRLRAACEIARRDPPRVLVGDLRNDLASLAAQAPPEATLVVFHTAVLSYVPDAAQRAAFARTVGELGATWIANEGPEFIPGISEEVARERPPGQCLLCVDRQPTAWTDPHGTWVQWR